MKSLSGAVTDRSSMTRILLLGVTHLLGTGAIPDPIRSFAEAAEWLPEQIMQQVTAAGFTTPSAIQVTIHLKTCTNPAVVQ